MHTEQVSFADEPLILVNADDEVLGHQDKASCHDGQGILHRAFSVFIFNSAGEVLLQERSAQKRLWPNIWANTCCSHPREGEEVPNAALRRLNEELGIEADLEFLYKFEYQASYTDKGSEHELCWVLIGQSDSAPQTNANEIAQTRYIKPDDLDAALKEKPQAYSPWLHLEWAELRQKYWAQIEAMWTTP
ncbi:MAG: isopentenyl-diphosphate Delta-isomerase [Myxococcota bacterium]|jgi:isopentenyl-diphosphate delta-isomerase|nr:isopentenyl-diphosphate Delta-isomerase [Myxococcota bacterium]